MYKRGQKLWGKPGYESSKTTKRAGTRTSAYAYTKKTTGRKSYRDQNRIVGYLGSADDAMHVFTCSVYRHWAHGLQAVPPDTGCTGCISAPAEGTAYNQRIGRNIVIRSCTIVANIMCIEQEDAMVEDSFYCTLYLVLDMQTRGAAASTSDIWEDPAGTLSGDLATNIMRNQEYIDRFQILAEKRVKIDNFNGWNVISAAWRGFTTRTPIELTWEGEIPVTFTKTGTTATIANVDDCSLQVFVGTNQSVRDGRTHLGLVPIITYQSRIYYTT